ncbi:aldo/keto reductase family domain-containing protein [Hirsutella rhossiliensis]|uniref:Aldo/keto reductase family domain-containing protein n=1 Tax=Hirsutella rhossiliensis TaxID=111463 RepID=A0A9P8MKI0_9HYPO|nr:aldo/keto reductase family domain-containing protein [Hirsutella rhossiliensis]KAH0957017.1 aldo/keto reductase family domain-containing protein [Hirsutella rhossiliensis]
MGPRIILVIASVETSLKELGTDCVDILYLHKPDRTTPFQETLGAMDKLHKAGKFVRFGISNFTAYEMAEVMMICKYNNWVRPSIFQGMYNCITRNIETELFTACRRYGLDIVAYNPLAGGLFSGKIKSHDMVPERSVLGYQLSLTMIEAALRWVVHHSELKINDGNDGILIGVSSVAQLDDNLTYLEKGPCRKKSSKLDEAWQISRADSPNYWHGDLDYGYDTIQALFGPGAQ